MDRKPNAGPPRTLVLAFIGALLGFGLLAVAGYEWLGPSHAGPTAIGGPFHLQAAGGRDVTPADYRGRYMLVYFGYTFCPDVCPTTLAAVADALDRLGTRADRVQPVFITVDPERDTPDIVDRYARSFSPRITGLSGTPDEIAQVARAYRVYYAAHHAADDHGAYSVDHSSVLYLMGPDGAFVAALPADGTGQDIAGAISQRMS